MSKVAKMTMAEGMAALMDIIGDAEIKVADTPKTSPVTNPTAKKVGPSIVYENNSIIEIDGKKVTTGPKKRGRTGGKDDAGKKILRPIYVAAVEEFAAKGKVFQHSTEGMIVRLEEADYAIKITKSITPKFDAVEDNVEADFSTRGKAKNSAGAIARKIYSAIAVEAKEDGKGNLTDFKIVSARASGIVVQGALGEYTIKISKKRERVGFEAEKASAFEK